MNGYILTLHERVLGKAVLIDPCDRIQLLKEGLTREKRKPLRPEEVQAVFIERQEVLRQVELELLLQSAAHFPEGGARLLKPGEVARWGLRPMHWAEVEESGGGLVVVSVEGLTEPDDVKAIPYYGDFRLHKDFANRRVPLERIEEIAKNPPPDIEEAQLRDIRKGGVLLMRTFSYYAPLLEGMFILDSGPEKSGKSFAMRMVLYLLRWLLLAEDPNARLIALFVGERPDELGEIERLAASHPQIAFFGTAMDDLPITKWLHMAYAALERVKRELELGRRPWFFLDSVSRLAEAISTSRDEARTTGGHTLSALVEPRSFLGVAGRYTAHPTEPTCTVIVTGLRETHPFHDAPTHQLGGTSTGDWRFSGKIAGQPKIDTENDHTSTRNLSWVGLTELERWFVGELRERVAERGKGGKFFNLDAAVEYLAGLFEHATPQEVMQEWDRVRRKNDLYLAFRMSADQTHVVVDELDLTFEQVQQLVEATLADDLVELFEAGCNIKGFLAGEVTEAELYAPFEEYRREWSNKGYTDAVGKDTVLSNLACDPLREAGIGASLVRQLVVEGYEFSKITEAARRDASPDTIRERLGQTTTDTKNEGERD